MGSYLDLLRVRAKEVSGPVCFGLDPEPMRLPPGSGSLGERITGFYLRILERLERDGALPAVVKPNLAYYERLGDEGAAVLQRVLERCRELELPVLLDAKRGDIGTSSAAYAQAVFETWGADATTVSPFLGGDSISPFTRYCSQGKGVYVLCRTSNPGAAELQDLQVEGRPLHEHVAERIAGSWYLDGIGAVLGATAPEPLERVAEIFLKAERAVSLLLPGIGSQGGSADVVARRLRGVGYDLGICLFAVSSGISDAWRKNGTDDFAGAASDAMKRLQDEIGAA